MRIRAYEFSLRELSGSMGDLGTLFPLAIGYMTICKMNPAGLLVAMGLANIVTGIVYKLPMPIEPMKVLAVVAIANVWTPEQICTAGVVMGAVWLLMGATGAMTFVARWTPKSVVQGLQTALGILLAVEGLKLIGSGWILGLLSVAVILGLRDNRYAPAGVVLVVLGIGMVLVKGQWPASNGLHLALPGFARFVPSEAWPVFRDGCIAQILLTATNAVIATSALLARYFPERRVTERQLSFNMGIMNAALPWIGGMPLCHGAGGLAGQYYFGARTGGANIIEGTIEIALGLCLAGTIAAVFAAFPQAIVGAMMLMVGLKLALVARQVESRRQLLPAAATVIAAIAWNMAAGFAAGLFVCAIEARLRDGDSTVQ